MYDFKVCESYFDMPICMDLECLKPEKEKEQFTGGTALLLGSGKLYSIFLHWLCCCCWTI